MDKPIDLNDMPKRANQDPHEITIPIDEALRRPPTFGDLQRMAKRQLDALTDGSQAAHTAALNNLADAVNQLAKAITARSTPPTSEAVPAEAGSPGPAKGLITQVRHMPDHRNPNARSDFGFAPVKASDDLGMGDSEP